MTFLLPLLTVANQLTTRESTSLALNNPRLEFWGGLFKTGFYLALVLLLIFFLKKYALTKVTSLQTKGRVQVLSKNHLDPQTVVYTLGFQRKRWIVLVGRTSMTTLHDYEENE